ncbi:hypothetical protein BV25DRAFT_605443 [Artomyces pyxidatus]|uniref:Uncharacterized protein n=1 Tax=Artomyces pyxidatus TaxID=48021 RepID=A0ACB8T2K9_9AGAM|nr:hypothetical protein BV25DRAFT_605443 [Artomyces pyxidatus]
MARAPRPRAREDERRRGIEDMQGSGGLPPSSQRISTGHVETRSDVLVGQSCLVPAGSKGRSQSEPDVCHCLVCEPRGSLASYVYSGVATTSTLPSTPLRPPAGSPSRAPPPLARWKMCGTGSCPMTCTALNTEQNFASLILHYSSQPPRDAELQKCGVLRTVRAGAGRSSMPQ